MKLFFSIAALIVLFILYLIIYKVGMSILRSNKKSFIKKWGNAVKASCEEKEKDLKFHLTLYFIVLYILLVVLIFSA